MQNRIDINGRALGVWSCSGRVDHITLRSNTEVWTQGGGGYVGPHGGYLSAPQVQSRTTEYKEVRISSDDGSVRTIDAAGRVTCVPGDRISFIYASEPAVAKGPLVGIINYTEGRWWSFDRPGLTTEPLHRIFKRMRILGVIGAALTVGSWEHYKWADTASAAITFVVLALGSIFVFSATLRAAARTFEIKVNQALQEEIARRCAAGDDAPVRAHPSHLTQQAVPRASAGQFAAV
jgi:hypothetical protein